MRLRWRSSPRVLGGAGGDHRGQPGGPGARREAGSGRIAEQLERWRSGRRWRLRSRPRWSTAASSTAGWRHDRRRRCHRVRRDDGIHPDAGIAQRDLGGGAAPTRAAACSSISRRASCRSRWCSASACAAGVAVAEHLRARARRLRAGRLPVPVGLIIGLTGRSRCWW